MVPVASGPNEINAQIIGARLGAVGIVWELRPNVGAPYAVGAVEVMVESDRVEEARELLLADEVESVFAESEEGEEGEEEGGDGGLWVFAVALFLLVVFVVVRLMSLA
jgi:hypothetical protein